MAQQAEAESWADFGTSPRHFSPEYWDWELTHLGLSLHYFESLDSCNLLEIGCGPFGIIHFVETNGLKVGVDPLAHKLVGMGFGNSKRVTHIAAIGEKLPFSNEAFDIIICFNVLDHVAEPKQLLEECKRVIRPGGILILNVNVLPQYLRTLRPIFGWLDHPHPHHWSFHQIIYMLDLAGYEIKFAKCGRRANYRFHFGHQTGGILPIDCYLRVGENKYMPAKGSALKHSISSLIHLRADVVAKRRGFHETIGAKLQNR